MKLLKNANGLRSSLKKKGSNVNLFRESILPNDLHVRLPLAARLLFKLNLYVLILVSLAFSIFVPVAALAQAVPSGLALEGTIFTAAGIPEESSSVSFTIQIKSPGAESCVLYQETQTLNMSNSGGTFAFTIGQGVRPNSGFESTSSLHTTFNNSPTPFSGLTCHTGSTYTPTPGDKRSLIMTFNDGTGSQTVTQALDTESVPYALFADSLQGKLPGDFISVNNSTAALTQANLESVFNNPSSVTALEALIAGSSSLYAKSTAAGGVSIPTYAGAPSTPTKGSVWFNTGTNTLNFYDGTSNRTVGTSGGSVTSVTAGSGLSGGTITTSGTISMPAVGSTGTYTKVTTDAQGRVSSGSLLAAGDIPNLDAAKITTGTLASSLIPTGTDTTKLPLAGGTMTGSIAMGNNNLTNTGFITQHAQTYLGLGTFTDAGETTLIGTLGPAYAGATWYNSTSNQIKYWNGTATSVLATGSTAIASLNGIATATQTFANGTAGTAPAFNSSGSTHTLNIPLASGAGTTAGLLSNADYAEIIRKDGAVAFTADESMGSHKLTNVTDPAAAQDAATKNYADLHVASKTLDPSLSTLVSASAGQGSLLTWDQTNNRWTAAVPATSGTVTSVGLSLPSIFTVTNSPVTTSGILTGSLANQSGNTVLAGPTSGSGVPAFRQLNINDLKSSVAGPLFVAPNCSASQTLTWTAITDNFNCQSIGTLSWSAISSGLPTTLGGYGITDAVQNAGGSPSVQSGIDSAKPLSPAAGAIYIAGDTKVIYQYNSGSWVAIASSSGSGGTLTALTGDVSASGTGSVAATVNSVGGSTAASVHTAELLAKDL